MSSRSKMIKKERVPLLNPKLQPTHPVVTNPLLYAVIRDKIKASVKVWPSAYASGMVVKEYKRVMAAKGLEAYTTATAKPSLGLSSEIGLQRWFAEKWIDIATGKPCGSVHTATNYPTCRPSIRVSAQTPRLASEFSEKAKKELVGLKQIAREKKIDFSKR